MKPTTALHAGAGIGNPTDVFYGGIVHEEEKACHPGHFGGRGDQEEGCAGQSCPGPKGWMGGPCCWSRVLKTLLPAPLLLLVLMVKTKGKAPDQPVGQATSIVSMR